MKSNKSPFLKLRDLNKKFMKENGITQKEMREIIEKIKNKGAK